MAIEDLFVLLDHVPTPVFVMNIVGQNTPVYAHYNAAALSQLNRPLSDFLGRTTMEAFGAEYGTAALLEQQETIRSRKRRKYEFKLPFEGEIQVVRTTLSPQMNADGEVIRLIGSAQNVSAEWIAAQAHSRINTINSEVEQFITMAAHDLRTPMRNVASLAEMLAEEFEDQGDGKMELIELLGQTSEKSMALISDVLGYASAMSAGGEAVLFDLRDLTNDIMAVLDPKGKHRIVCTAMTVTGEKPVVQIILRNLMDNAFKHGKCARMELVCSARETSEGWVEIEMGDNGGGFANPGTAFLDSGDFRVDSGYGLLGIRRLITSRGGTITAENNAETGGSVVRFSLPLQVVSSMGGVKQLPRAVNQTHSNAPPLRNVS